MNNFTFQNPTKLIFGKGTIAKLAKEIPTDKKLMITFGSGSVKKNGVYEERAAIPLYAVGSPGMFDYDPIGITAHYRNL